MCMKWLLSVKRVGNYYLLKMKEAHIFFFVCFFCFCLHNIFALPEKWRSVGHSQFPYMLHRMWYCYLGRQFLFWIAIQDHMQEWGRWREKCPLTLMRPLCNVTTGSLFFQRRRDSPAPVQSIKWQIDKTGHDKDERPSPPLPDLQVHLSSL